MKSETNPIYDEYQIKSLDIIKGTLNIPFLISKLESIDRKFEEVKRLVQEKPELQSPRSRHENDWRDCELVSVKKCAEIINQSERTVRNLVKRGLLEQSKATRHKKITVRSVLAYVDRTV
jgi:predicted nuclease with RNAse H fold